MANFAKIENGAVVSIILSNAPFAAHEIEIPSGLPVVIGTEYDTDTGTFDVVPVEVAAPVPQSLTAPKFVNLMRSAGGMTVSMIAQSRAHSDENLQGMWALFSLPGAEIERDDPDVQAGMQLLAVLGFLPNGAQAVLDAWPVQG
tara:strand:+ start:80 stop:511 length:432 start_codon:yes stop_codon:yes gene_type:complete